MMCLAQLRSLRYGSSGDDTVRGVSDLVFALVERYQWKNGVLS